MCIVEQGSLRRLFILLDDCAENKRAAQKDGGWIGGYKEWSRDGFMNIKDLYNNDVGKGVIMGKSLS